MSAPAPPDTTIANTAILVISSLADALNQLAENCAGEFRINAFPNAMTVLPASTYEKLSLTKHLIANPMTTSTQLILTCIVRK